MTAQIGDILKHQHTEYTLAALSGRLPFDPKAYGMEPQMSATICRRGYWCQYIIDDGILTLDELYLCSHDNNFPLLNGVRVCEAEFEEVTVQGKKGIKQHTIPKYAGHRAYRNVNLPLPYTGKLLVGKNFLPAYYSHAGFQRYWAYTKLMEFVFEDGILMETNDYSDLARCIRKQLKEYNAVVRFPDADSIPAFTADDFPLDYAANVRLFNYNL